MFCKHNWEMISETTTKSKFQVTTESAYKEGMGTKKFTIPWQLCDADRKFIQIVQCTKCGKLKRFVESI